MQSPAITMSRGQTYVFNQTNSSNQTHAIYFSESEDAYGGVSRYETGVVYKINGESVSWNDYNVRFNDSDGNGNPPTTRSIEITVAANAPDTLHYVCQNHAYMGNAINIKSDVTNTRNFVVINDPILGTHTITSKTDTAFVYKLPLAPESGYVTGVSYSTNSIYPSGGIATITIGDNGRNYQSLPVLTGSTRSGSGATAVATISGGITSVGISNNGQGYSASNLPSAIITMPDFVDITLESVLGNFLPDEVIIGKAVQDDTTARGKVISWNPITSVLRLQPLQNTRPGSLLLDNKGYIMFNDGKKYNINPSQIDTLANPETFEFAAHNAKTGDPVKYTAAQTNPIQPLVVGQTYYIIDMMEQIVLN